MKSVRPRGSGWADWMVIVERARPTKATALSFCSELGRTTARRAGCGKNGYGSMSSVLGRAEEVEEDCGMNEVWLERSITS